MSTLLVIQEPLSVTTPSALEKLPENTLVTFQGKVLKETPHYKAYRLTLDNNLTLLCSCHGFIQKKIQGSGTLNTYRGNNILVKKIEEIR
jgi:hypothetical protein